MTITVTSIVAGPYVATGAAQVLPFAFKVFTPEEVEVVVGPERDPIDPDLYTVSINKAVDGQIMEGGSINLSALAVAPGETVNVIAKPAKEQGLVFSDTGSRLRNLNEGLDRAALRALRAQYDGAMEGAGAELIEAAKEAGTEAGQAAGQAAAADKADKNGLNLTPDVFKQGARITAATIADAAALPVGAARSLVVEARTDPGDGYAGIFEWVAGDQYPNVINDPLKGIWIPGASDPTGSVGAWKRAYDTQVNVKWFGAKGDGIADDTAAFSAAAKATLASDYIGGNLQSSLARPLRGYVHVSPGSYSIGSLVDTGGRDIVWLLASSAVVTPPENLNGQIWRGNSRVTLQNPMGISDYATGFAASIGGAIPDKPAPVTGVITLQQLADYPNRDAVGLIGAAYSPTAAANITTATYTATTVTFASPSANTLKRLRRGMILDTKHATRCTALISSWATVGGNLVITVAEWRAKGGSSAVTPTNGVGLYISRTDKVWGANMVANLLVGGDADQAIGIETSVYNAKGDSSATIGDATNRVWGNYVFNAGPFKVQASFMSSGGAHWGYVSHNTESGFYAYADRTLPGAGFTSQGFPTVLIGKNMLGQQTFRLTSAGTIEMGNIDVAGQPYIDFRSSGDATVDYDGRISCVGGTPGVNGSGTVVVNAEGMRFSVSRMGFFGAASAPRAVWAAPSGFGSRLTFDSATITLPELAARMKALIDDLRSYGLLG